MNAMRALHDVQRTFSGVVQLRGFVRKGGSATCPSHNVRVGERVHIHITVARQLPHREAKRAELLWIALVRFFVRKAAYPLPIAALLLAEGFEGLSAARGMSACRLKCGVSYRDVDSFGSTCMTTVKTFYSPRECAGTRARSLARSPTVP
jgi:hypothetical protein